MYTYEYPRPAVSVDVVVFTVRASRLQALFIRRRNAPFAGAWALPGGFVDIDESLEAAAGRELAEETGLRAVYLEQLYTYGEPERDPRGRVVSVAYYALIPADVQARPEGGDDADQTRWFPVDELPALAFDHAEILSDAVRRLRNQLEYSAVGFKLLPEAFTLSELQRTYEIVLGETLDKRNFRRRILQAGIIEATPGRRSREGRPARRYRYRPEAVAGVKARR